MNVHDVRAALAEAVRSIDGMRSSAFVPTKVVPPMAVVSVGSGTYDDDTSGGMTLALGLLVLVSRSDDRTAQAKLDDYITPSGDRSVKAAIEADLTLGGTVDSVAVVGWGDPAEFEVGGTSYVGVEFDVEAVD